MTKAARSPDDLGEDEMVCKLKNERCLYPLAWINDDENLDPGGFYYPELCVSFNFAVSYIQGFYINFFLYGHFALFWRQTVKNKNIVA